MKIYLDFEGTVIESGRMTRENFGCMPIIKKLQDAGHEIILNTYRADTSQESLEKALDFINYHRKVELQPIKALPRKVTPPSWDLPSAIHYGVLYIDDISYGIPLKPCCMVSGKMVDWEKLDKQFQEHNLYNNDNKGDLR